MSSSRDMAVANFMPQCADFVFICVLTGFLQTAIIKKNSRGVNTNQAFDVLRTSVSDN